MDEVQLIDMANDPEFTVLQVCENGHVVGDSLEVEPVRDEQRCGLCGAKTIQRCPACHHAIRSRWRTGEGFVEPLPQHPPRACHECKTPYPWTERALVELSRIVRTSKLTGLQVVELITAAKGIMIEYPDSERHAVAFKRLVSAAGSAAARKLLAWADEHALAWVLVRFLHGPTDSRPNPPS